MQVVLSAFQWWGWILLPIFNDNNNNFGFIIVFSLQGRHIEVETLTKCAESTNNQKTKRAHKFIKAHCLHRSRKTVCLTTPLNNFHRTLNFKWAVLSSLKIDTASLSKAFSSASRVCFHVTVIYCCGFIIKQIDNDHVVPGLCFPRSCNYATSINISISTYYHPPLIIAIFSLQRMRLSTNPVVRKEDPRAHSHVLVWVNSFVHDYARSQLWAFYFGWERETSCSPSSIWVCSIDRRKSDEGKSRKTGILTFFPNLDVSHKWRRKIPNHRRHLTLRWNVCFPLNSCVVAPRHLCNDLEFCFWSIHIVPDH